MAEAIAALGLASNVFQVIQFARFVSRIADVYDSGVDALHEVQNLRTAAKNLEEISKQLESLHRQASGSDLDNSLAEDCKAVLRDLQDLLGDVGTSDERKVKGAFKAAFKAQWNRQKLDHLRQRATVLHEGLNAKLIISVRDIATKSLDQQALILERLDKLKAPKELRAASFKVVASSSRATATRAGGLGRPASRGLYSSLPGNRVIDFVTRNAFHAGDQDPEDESTRSELVAQILTSQPTATEFPAYNLSSERRADLILLFISKFEFDGMLNRETSIGEAHEKTFRWIFEDPPPAHKRTWVSFKTWLQSDQPLYWITGKAGSGKSTLMKYISQTVPQEEVADNIASSSSQQIRSLSARCRDHLHVWAGERKLILVTFYFWAAGTAIEASREALLRSLLYQILLQNQDIVPNLSPRHWEVLCLFGDTTFEFREEELQSILLHVVKETCRKHSLCLFVDGLDEFDGPKETLISLFQQLVDLPCFKLCVASRPWVVFQDAFDHQPSLMLQDITYPDILSYINSAFQNDAGFSRLQEFEPDFSATLVTDIADKSSGVFLWVNLVVKSLLTGMSNDDRISDLQRRLDLLPPDLENLYTAILDSLDPFYFDHAVQYFRLMQSLDMHECVQEALLFSFADENDPDFAIKLPWNVSLQPPENLRISSIRRRINSRCKGLLELVSQESLVGDGTCITIHVVQYLHRTVKEYIGSAEVQVKFRERLPHFDAHLQVCSAFLAAAKLPPDIRPRRMTTRYAQTCVRAAASVSKRSNTRMISLLDDILRLYPAMQTSPWGIWANDSWYRPPSLVSPAIPTGTCNPMCYITHAGVVEYIKSRCTSDSGNTLWGYQSNEQSKGISERLKRVIRINPPREKTEFCSLLTHARNNVEMVSALLNIGFDPNSTVALDESFKQRNPGLRITPQFQKAGQYTAWQYYILTVIWECDPEHLGSSGFSGWVPAARLYIEAGAKIQAMTADVLKDRVGCGPLCVRQSGSQCKIEHRMAFTAAMKALAQGISPFGEDHWAKVHYNFPALQFPELI